jgi:hypothetical protein
MQRDKMQWIAADSRGAMDIPPDVRPSSNPGGGKLACLNAGMGSRAHRIRGGFRKGLSGGQCIQGRWQRHRVSKASFLPRL